MAKRTAQELAEDIRRTGVEGRVAGVHSNLMSLGLIEPTPVSAEEEAAGLSPIAKTVINAFLAAVGREGTFFVPTHSCNFIGNYAPSNRKVEVKKDENGNVRSTTLVDDGYYDPAKSPSLVGALTQALLADRRARRSGHPTHSIAAIGKETEYLIRGHDARAQPVGIHNAFTKTVGLDGVILFIGDTVESNTTFHAYETVMLPALAEYFSGTAAVEMDGVKRLINMTWVPNLHRDFYAGKKRRTRAIEAMRASGLLKEGRIGRGGACWFEAKPMARYFAEQVFPREPDILFCARKEDCSLGYECGHVIRIMKSLYAGPDGKWDAAKITGGYDRTYAAMLKPGVVRVSY